MTAGQKVDLVLGAILAVAGIVWVIRAIWFAPAELLSSKVSSALWGFLLVILGLFRIGKALQAAWVTPDRRAITILAVLAACIISWLVARRAEKRREIPKP